MGWFKEMLGRRRDERRKAPRVPPSYETVEDRQAPRIGFDLADVGGMTSTPGGVGPRFVVLDVETTGLAARNHRIIELALVTTDRRGRVLDEWSTRLNPEGPVGATHIHGITDADVRDSPRFADIVDELTPRIAGGAIVAHNARFDLAFLRAEFARARWRLPHLPALCTLEASVHHLPDLARRRLSDCCEAVGHQLHGAHSAIGDAFAAAALLAHYVDERRGSPVSQEHLRLLEEAAAVSWPTKREERPVSLHSTDDVATRRVVSDRARRNMAASSGNARSAEPLVQLVERFTLVDALDEGAPAGAINYLEKLAEVLEDGVLTSAEAAGLEQVAVALGLDAAGVASTHRAFVLALAHAALSDGKVTRAETEELQVVAELLGVERRVVSDLVAAAEAARHARLSANLGPLPSGWGLGEPLRVGDRVVFTGCESAGRDDLQRRCADLGVRVLNSVSARTAMLVTDGTVRGGKHDKAVALSTRMVDPETFAVLLANLQPAGFAEGRHDVVSPQSTGVQATKAAGFDTALSGETRSDDAVATGAASPAVVRAWGRDNGWVVGQRGRLPAGLIEAYAARVVDGPDQG